MQTRSKSKSDIPDTPQFFVPDVKDANKELVYTSLAMWCGVPVPNIGKRIYSIVFSHNDETWTATVGETLRGIRNISTKSQGIKVELSQVVTDSALVLAIFSGVPFIVVTNHNILGDVGSHWSNPFFAAEPISITYFPNKNDT